MKVLLSTALWMALGSACQQSSHPSKTQPESPLAESLAAAKSKVGVDAELLRGLVFKDGGVVIERVEEFPSDDLQAPAKKSFEFDSEDLISTINEIDRAVLVLIQMRQEQNADGLPLYKGNLNGQATEQDEFPLSEKGEALSFRGLGDFELYSISADQMVLQYFSDQTLVRFYYRKVKQKEFDQIAAKFKSQLDALEARAHLFKTQNHLLSQVDYYTAEGQKIWSSSLQDFANEPAWMARAKMLDQLLSAERLNLSYAYHLREVMVPVGPDPREFTLDPVWPRRYRVRVNSEKKDDPAFSIIHREAEVDWVQNILYLQNVELSAESLANLNRPLRVESLSEDFTRFTVVQIDEESLILRIDAEENGSYGQLHYTR